MIREEGVWLGASLVPVPLAALERAAEWADEKDEETPKARWRVGKKVPINVYDGDRPVCQCQTALDAALIVAAVNAMQGTA